MYILLHYNFNYSVYVKLNYTLESFNFYEKNKYFPETPRICPVPKSNICTAMLKITL